MRKTSKVQGTKIAQAAKNLNVTSVTIRRYISEFNIETTADENGIMVLPKSAMDELKEVRRLKEDGNTNPKVLEFLEEQRAKAPKAKKSSKAEEADEAVEEEESEEEEAPKKTVRAKRVTKKATTTTTTRKRGRKAADEEVAEDEDEEEEKAEEAEEQEEEKPAAPKRARRTRKKSDDEEAESGSDEDEEKEEDDEDSSSEGRQKHSLTCQTCSKTFEHMNPRLRDCLDCYRAKRKERRRGGDKHKNVIQHPLAQQVVNKMAANQQTSSAAAPAAAAAPSAPTAPKRPERPQQRQIAAAQSTSVTQPIIGGLKTKVRSYRKAIEETRHITGSLKRRLERPDLPEGDRRWLEQIYAYQLILHQGWRHLSEYKSATQAQSKLDDKKK